MTTEATQQGADVEQEQPLTLGHSARNAALAQIAKQTHDALAPDLQDFDEDTGAVLPRKEAQEKEEEPERVEEESAPSLETIVVDGQTVQVPADRIREAGIRTLQKESAADKRLAEATQTLARAKEYLARVQPPDEGTQPPGEGVATERGATLDERTLADVVDSRLYVSEAQKAANRFRSEFSDIVNDPNLYSLAVSYENERLARAAAVGEPLGDPWEAYRGHGEKIRKWLTDQGLKSQTGMEAKTDRKRQAVTVTGAGVRAPTQEAPKVKTQSQIIEDMRKARGQRIN